MDITTYNAGGYHGDLNETFCVGNVDADGQRVVRTAFDCLAAALELVKPGTLYRDLGTVIERVARANKCSVVRTYCGHGIGSLFHTIPNIPHYGKNKAKGTMKKGHVFTIEPVRDALNEALSLVGGINTLQRLLTFNLEGNSYIAHLTFAPDFLILCNSALTLSLWHWKTCSCR